MGAAASELLVDNCHPRCMEACPHVAYEADLQGRGTRRKETTTATRLRSKATQQSSVFDKQEPGFGAVCRVESSDDMRPERARRQIACHEMFCGEANLIPMTSEGTKAQFLSMATKSLEEREAEEATVASKARLALRRPDDDLMHGAMRGDLKRVQKALEMRADPLKANSRGIVPLMLAASSSGKEALEVLKELLQRQADVQTRDRNGWTSFLYACRNGKTQAVKELMARGSDPSAMTKDHKTSLMLAVLEGKVDLVRELITVKQAKQQIGERDNLGATALHFAVKGGALEITRSLLESSAKSNAKDVDSRTPLMWACEHGELECARSLAKSGAEIDLKDKASRSALLYACLNNYEGMALWLVKKGADPYATDASGDCALTLAQETGLPELKRFIKTQALTAEEAADEAGAS